MRGTAVDRDDAVADGKAGELDGVDRGFDERAHFRCREIGSDAFAPQARRLLGKEGIEHVTPLTSPAGHPVGQNAHVGEPRLLLA